ncbi:MAG: hypothetical protein V4655_12530 [Bdellovibrionota bacterium]
MRFILALMVMVSFACGREASRTLRQGQLPIYDFPLYLTEGVPGRVWRIEKDKSKTLLAEGLMDPRGIATDKLQNVYVAEYGAGRVLKFPAGSSNYVVMADNLLSPSVVSVDSFGDVYVAQDGATNVIRLSDRKVFGTYASVPSAFTFGVDDIPIIGLFNENRLSWSWDINTNSTTIDRPNNAAIDGTGRVYVAEADPLAGRVHRFHQREPGASVVVAEGLLGPTGLAVDLVGNLFIVEQGASRIVLVTFDNKKFAWMTEISDGQYLAFSQY